MTERPSLHRTAMVSVLALAAAVVLLLSFATPKASAGGAFCQEVWLAPYGKGGDRCWGPSVYGLSYAALITHERAGCVTIADGSNNLLTSWVCGAAGSAPANAAELWLANYAYNRKGVIRNNNLSYGGYFRGTYNCSINPKC